MRMGRGGGGGDEEGERVLERGEMLRLAMAFRGEIRVVLV